MPIKYEKANGVGTVTLSRPAARNAWGQDLTDGIRESFADMELDDDIRCAVLTGDPAGNAFSAGANLKDPNTHTQRSMADFIKGIPNYRRGMPFDVIGDFPKPVIASVNGYAVGIGCILTFCCDLIVASEQAEWRLPQVALGILPAYGGGARLARWVGKGVAMRLAMGFPLAATEAHQIGLAQWLTTPEELQNKTAEVANHIAALPPLATRMVKESISSGMNIPNIGDASLADLYRFMALELTEDKSEGHDAWREKRPAKFTGR
jgi:enoyl-CoA hydratase/carnithine racemase